MNEFGTILSRLERELPLPQPARARVLLEVAADLEAFFELARRQGRSEAEAQRLALETFGPSSDAVAALVDVHGSTAARLMEVLAGRSAGLLERGLLFVVAVIVLFAAAPAFVDTRIFHDAGPAAWVVSAFAVLAVFIGLVKIYLLFLKRDHRPRQLRFGLEAMLWFTTAPAFLGFAVFLMDAFDAIGVVAANWPDAGGLLGACLVRGHAVLAIALAETLVASIFWFVVNGRVARIEEQNAEILLELKGDER